MLQTETFNCDPTDVTVKFKVDSVRFISRLKPQFAKFKMKALNKIEDTSTKDTNMKVLRRKTSLHAHLSVTAHVTAMMKLQCDYNLV